MTNIVVHITIADIITSFILYGIVHAAWSGVKWCLQQLETETGRIIDLHVKDRHTGPFKRCFKGSCATPGTGIDSLHQAMRAEQQD